MVVNSETIGEDIPCSSITVYILVSSDMNHQQTLSYSNHKLTL